MAFKVLQVLLLFICNSYYCLSRGMEEPLFASVREAIGEIKAIGQKVREMENTVSSKFEDMSSKLEEMENTMSSKFEGQLAELQGTSNVEGVLQLCAESMEMERGLESQTLARTSTKMDQIAHLQESFAAELKGIEPSISAKVSILQQALAGCPSGFTSVPGAGCLKTIHENKSFDDAIARCSTLSAQLVVPLVFQGLQDYIGESLRGQRYWVGVIGRQWSTGRDVAQAEWLPGQPDGDVTECAYIERSTLRIRDWSCRNPSRFICQLK